MHFRKIHIYIQDHNTLDRTFQKIFYLRNNTQVIRLAFLQFDQYQVYVFVFYLHLLRMDMDN